MYTGKKCYHIPIIQCLLLHGKRWNSFYKCNGMRTVQEKRSKVRLLSLDYWVSAFDHHLAFQTETQFISMLSDICDRLCGLVVRVPGYRSRDPGFDSFQIFWEVVGLEWGPLSPVSINEELLEWKSIGYRSRNPKLTAVGICCADHATPFTHKFGTNFADMWPSLGWYSSLADYSHGVQF
jgi:hypothetical protein